MITKYVAAVALLVFATGAASAQETARVNVGADSKLWIEGTSNLHEWSCKATQFDAAIDVDAAAAATFAASAPKALKKVSVRVPVKSLKCGHGAMDDNLYKALNADDKSAITYSMVSFDATSADAKDFALNTLGTLTIAGKENKVAIKVDATRLADGSLKATGSVPVKMTDFGIKPPTAIFGRLKTGDEVMVRFELVVGAKAIASALDR